MGGSGVGGLGGRVDWVGGCGGREERMRWGDLGEVGLGDNAVVGGRVEAAAGDPDGVGVDAGAGRAAGVEGEAQARDDGEAALALGVLRHAVLQRLQQLRAAARPVSVLWRVAGTRAARA
jgi:hypothetical protein